VRLDRIARGVAADKGRRADRGAGGDQRLGPLDGLCRQPRGALYGQAARRGHLGMIQKSGCRFSEKIMSNQA